MLESEQQLVDCLSMSSFGQMLCNSQSPETLKEKLEETETKTDKKVSYA